MIAYILNFIANSDNEYKSYFNKKNHISRYRYVAKA